MKKFSKKQLIEDVKDMLDESLQGYNANHEWHYMRFYDGEGRKLGEIAAHQYDVYDSIDPGDRSSELDNFIRDVLPHVVRVDEYRGNSWSDDDDKWSMVVVDNLGDIEKIRRRVRDSLNKAPADVILNTAIRLGVKLS